MAINAPRIYQDLRRLWLSTADPASKDEAEREFDEFVKSLVEQGAELAAKQAQEAQEKLAPESTDEEVSTSRMLMEIILELDTTMNMVPPRVKTCRDLLAAEGLDKTSSVEGEDGTKGLAGINLADQAALEFHRALLGLAVTFAQAEAHERLHGNA